METPPPPPPSFAVPLEAKRTARDEKLKKLQNLLSHQTNTPPTNSYQHGGIPDIESSGHIVLLRGNDDDDEPRLLREQMQSFIHLDDENIQPNCNSTGTCASMISSSENFVNNMDPRQKFIGMVIMLFLLYWWL
jgi:hypothetical protein